MPRPQNSVRGTIATTGQTTDLTAANLRTMIASDSGGGTTLFLRADGSWAIPAGGAGGEPSEGDKGDITVASGVWNIDSSTITATEIASNAVGSEEIAAGAVTYAKIQNVTAARVLGSIAGGAPPEEMSASAVLDLIGSTRGTILYRGASGWAVLAVGADGRVLTTHGAGADPTWEVASGGSGLSHAQVMTRGSYGP